MENNQQNQQSEKMKKRLQAIGEDDKFWNAKVLSDFPTVIAVEYVELRKLFQQKNTYGAMLKIKDIYELMLRYPLVLALSYLDSSADGNIAADDVYIKAMRDLFDGKNGLTLGSWVKFTRDHFLKNEQLPECLKNVLKTTVETLYKQTNKHDFVNWRNEKIGHGALKAEYDLEFCNEIIFYAEKINNGKFVDGLSEQYKNAKLYIDNTLMRGVEKLDKLENGGELKLELTESDYFKKDDEIRYIYIRDRHLFLFDHFLRKDAHKEQRIKCLDYLHADYHDEKSEYFERLRNQIADRNEKIRYTQVSMGDEIPQNRELSDLVNNFNKEMEKDYVEPEYINNWVKSWFVGDSVKSGCFALIMERGMGKSAFSAKLDQRYSDSVRLDKDCSLDNYVIRTYHCSRQNLFTADDFIIQINEMFREQKQAKDDSYLKDVYDYLLCSEDIEMGEKNKIAELLRYYQEEYAKRDKDKLLLIIDGLDEIKDFRIFDVFPTEEELSDGVYVLYTARTKEEIPALWDYIGPLLPKDENRIKCVHTSNEEHVNCIKKFLKKAAGVDLEPLAMQCQNFLVAKFYLVSSIDVSGTDNLRELFLRYIDALEKSYGKWEFDKKIVPYLILFAIFKDGISFKDVCVIEEVSNGDRLSFLGVLYDLEPILSKDTQAGSGAIYRLANIAYFDFLEEKYGENIKEKKDRLLEEFKEIVGFKEIEGLETISDAAASDDNCLKSIYELKIGYGEFWRKKGFEYEKFRCINDQLQNIAAEKSDALFWAKYLITLFRIYESNDFISYNVTRQEVFAYLETLEVGNDARQGVLAYLNSLEHEKKHLWTVYDLYALLIIGEKYRKIIPEEKKEQLFSLFMTAVVEFLSCSEKNNYYQIFCLLTENIEAFMFSGRVGGVCYLLGSEMTQEDEKKVQQIYFSYNKILSMADQKNDSFEWLFKWLEKRPIILIDRWMLRLIKNFAAYKMRFSDDGKYRKIVENIEQLQRERPIDFFSDIREYMKDIFYLFPKSDRDNRLKEYDREERIKDYIRHAEYHMKIDDPELSPMEIFLESPVNCSSLFWPFEGTYLKYLNPLGYIQARQYRKEREKFLEGFRTNKRFSEAVNDNTIILFFAVAIGLVLQYEQEGKLNKVKKIFDLSWQYMDIGYMNIEELGFEIEDYFDEKAVLVLYFYAAAVTWLAGYAYKMGDKDKAAEYAEEVLRFCHENKEYIKAAEKYNEDFWHELQIKYTQCWLIRFNGSGVRYNSYVFVDDVLKNLLHKEDISSLRYAVDLLFFKFILADLMQDYGETKAILHQIRVIADKIKHKEDSEGDLLIIKIIERFVNLVAYFRNCTQKKYLPFGAACRIFFEKGMHKTDFYHTIQSTDFYGSIKLNINRLMNNRKYLYFDENDYFCNEVTQIGEMIFAMMRFDNKIVSAYLDFVSDELLTPEIRKYVLEYSDRELINERDKKNNVLKIDNIGKGAMNFPVYFYLKKKITIHFWENIFHENEYGELDDILKQHQEYRNQLFDEE
ncbi:hypothetical protein [Schwartzia succinivorans]|jgi:hypothetical protein|uniref:Uncharacterized protein n=1 Tax=Schwartzia succinivorans DSM 10502 TaxID=1123243 RepID=A0A1M4Z670_9FIRM|nr:hypothetical protein [Schwartzia succinivorans]SHF13106.1 hypothetical protein SAMN02745190_01923 [Schwartzia succinivorans DSM 10502]